MSKHSVVSIDLAKNSFQICALNEHHKIEFNKNVGRNKLLNELRQIEATTVVMEACYSANPWGRAIQALGHEVKLIPPYQVKPFLIGNKNDANDAVAIAEASLRPKARFVRVKTLEQQDIQSLQRIRERLVRHHTAVINQLRGLLSEYGIAVRKHPAKLKQAIPAILEDAENTLTTVARKFIHNLYLEALELDEKIKQCEMETRQLLDTNPDFERLMTVPGVGPVIATALIASVGDGKQFRNGRHMSAWLGLTPSQYASGDTNRLGRISKRGNQSLRRLLIHGARAVVNWCHRKDDPLNNWIRSLLLRMHPCKAIVAVASKLARIAWSVLSGQTEYTPKQITGAAK
jgi:transposase